MRHFLLLVLMAVAGMAQAQELVIIHTNDTHSQLLPDRNDQGGIARRKVLIDSIKSANKNVILVDAGDAVQGSLYYTLFDGEVERKLMNMLGYDIQILGNHEFDKGMHKLAREWKQLNATKLSANYDFSQTELDGIFKKSVIKEFDGKKVGFLGLNLDPYGMIVAENIHGVKYNDPIDAAQTQANRLRKQGADYVVAISHLGFPDDERIAENTEGIDLIIGGHSHSLVSPAFKVRNLADDSTAIVQSGSRGVLLGEVKINLANGQLTSKMIPVDARLDSHLDSVVVKELDLYSAKVDSLKGLKIGFTPIGYEKGSDELLNLLSDFIAMEGRELSGEKVDLAILNKGGIRNSLPQGDITQGEIIDILPFDNKVVVMDILGEDLLKTFYIMASQGGNGISREAKAEMNDGALSVTISGQPLEMGKRYRLATIDYLAQGNDYMQPLSNGKIVKTSQQLLHQSLSKAINEGKLSGMLPFPDNTKRFSLGKE